MKNITASPITEFFCVICQEKLEPPFKRWLGVAPICKRCAEVHAEWLREERIE